MNRDDELERLLGARDVPPLRDPAAFVDRVMARVQASPRLALQPAASVPWWVEAATDPAAVLACVLLALVFWKPDALETLPRWTVPAAWITWVRSALLLDRPLVALVFEFAAFVAIGWISFRLYRWSERLMLRLARA